MDAARVAAAAWGWKLVAVPAEDTEDGSTSGGVGIMARQGILIAPYPRKPTKHASRWCPALVGGGKDQVLILSVYGYSGIGPRGPNVDLIREIGEFLAPLGHGIRILLGGDWNLDWEQFRQARGHSLGNPVPHEAVTCFPSTGEPRAIDFWVAPGMSATMIQDQLVREDLPMPTHRGVQLTLSLDVRLMYPGLWAPRNLPKERDKEKVPTNTHWDVGAGASAKQAYAAWAFRAESALLRMTEVKPLEWKRYRGRGLKPKPVTRHWEARKDRRLAAHVKGEANWLTLKRRLRELLRLREQGDPGGHRRAPPGPAGHRHTSTP